MGVLDDLAAAAAELYGLLPEDFVAARTEAVRRARCDGDRELAQHIGGLAKPTVAAWILNQLNRRRPDAVEQLVSLGGELREAQRSLAGDQMRALTRQRQAVVAAFARQAEELAEELGRPLGAAAVRQVDDTLRAAVSDRAAGDALLSGRLTAAMSYVGLGEVDVSAAVAAPAAPRRAPNRSTGHSNGSATDEPDELAAARQRRVDAARTELADAQAATERALGERDRREDLVRRLQVRADELAARIKALHADLERTGAEAEDVDEQLGTATSARDEAAYSVEEARATVERARSELDGLA